MAVAVLTLTLVSCLRDPYSDSEIMIPSISGWEVTSTVHGLGADLRKLYFITPEEGYIIGYNGYLMHTADSGKTWSAQDPGTDLHLGNIFFVDENVGFISGRGMDDCLNEDCGKGSFLLRTVDGGNTWDKVLYDTLAYLESMAWTDASHGIGLMEYMLPSGSPDKKLVRTTDSGNSWTIIDQAVPYTVSPSLICIGNTCYLAGADAVIKSSDFGDTWQVLPTPPHLTGGWYRIHFHNSNLGFIADNSAVYRTANGGQTWQRTDSDMTYFDGMHFYNSSEGFCFSVVAQYQGGDWPVIIGSYVYNTSDGGVTWFKSELFRNFYAGSVSFPSDGVGYGLNGTYFHRFIKD
jgi:photosystem II stability/assembly factor-like uncharacterized protein